MFLFNQIVVSLGYNRLHLDHCTYYNRFDEDDFTILLLCMDEELKTQLARVLDKTD